MPRPPASIPIALAVLMIVAGCGEPAPTPGAPPPTPADSAAVAGPKPTREPCRPILTEPGEVAYWGLGVRTYPAPPGAPATLTAQQARAGSDARSWETGGTQEEAELRLVSTGDFGCQSHPTGVVKRTGWVVTIHDTAPAPGGPPGTPPPDPTLRCTSVVILDARTGALLSNFQTCGDDPAVRSTISG